MGDDSTISGANADYRAEREEMVRTQIEKRGVRDARVLEAMRKVPRHEFVPVGSRACAYEDKPLPIGHGQTISQPYMVGLMTSLLQLDPNDRVLEIGTGSGYQAAVLSLLVREVFSVERIPELAESASMRLKRLGYRNVQVFQGDGTVGLPIHAPYDAILVTAGSPHLPQNLCDQLADGGRLVCPVGARDIQHLIRVIRQGEHFCQEEGIGCVFVPLVGENGWVG